MVKKSLKRKDGKCKVVISLNQKGQEASIKTSGTQANPTQEKTVNLNAV